MESDPSMTLRQLCHYVLETCNKTVCAATISNYLHGRLFPYKQVHYEPERMNEWNRKILRKEFVEQILKFINERKS